MVVLAKETGKFEVIDMSVDEGTDDKVGLRQLLV